jgi:collagenase-like PrtC family protease
MTAAPFRVAVGPVLYYWPRRTLTAFYAEVAESAARTVYLGELVCSRRHEMKVDDWLALARDLAAAGKEVVLSAQALIESDAELRTLRRLVDHGECMIEANDAAAIAAAAGRVRFVVGPHVNVYNALALAELAPLGAVRWVPPIELPIAAMAAVNPPGGAVETEAFAFGRMPLAISARCFTARHYRTNRDECGFRCIEHPDGLELRTQDGAPFLALNGQQTQAARLHCLLAHGAALAGAGVRGVRLSPVSQGFAQVVGAFDAVLNHGADAAAALAALADCGLPGAFSDGYAYGAAGLAWSAGGASQGAPSPPSIDARAAQ